MVGLSLIRFAGIAFPPVHRRTSASSGDREDRFFASVFLGSGLLFVGVLLVAEALTAAMVLSVHPSAQTGVAITPAWWGFSRNLTAELVEAGLQMAGVFTTATTARCCGRVRRRAGSR